MYSPRHTVCRTRGTALVETAVVLPVLLLLILGGLDFALQLHVLHTMTTAARDAARMRAVRGATEEQATAQAQAQLDSIHATFDITYPAADDPCDIKVRVSVAREAVSLGLYRLLGLSAGGTLRAEAVMRKEQ